MSDWFNPGTSWVFLTNSLKELAQKVNWTTLVTLNILFCLLPTKLNPKRHVLCVYKKKKNSVFTFDKDCNLTFTWLKYDLVHHWKKFSIHVFFHIYYQMCLLSTVLCCHWCSWDFLLVSRSCTQPFASITEALTWSVSLPLALAWTFSSCQSSVNLSKWGTSCSMLLNPLLALSSAEEYVNS